MSNNKLTRQQKEAVALLSFGTFLECFDLMLYVHMATLLNDLFFPQSDPITKQLFNATAFCLTYILRPIGGFLIGWIGDKFGRKSTILITTFLMAIACLIMVATPEYKERGIISTILVIIARMLQGFSSLGEFMGAYIYITETLKVPYRCMASGIIGFSGVCGGLFALAITSFILFMDLNWRWAFSVGAVIAGIGLIARTKLRETPEFVNYKLRVIDKMSKINKNAKVSINNEKVDKKIALAYFFTELHTPICLYVAIVYLSGLMKQKLGFVYADIATHNLKALVLSAILLLLIIYVVKKYTL